MTADEQKRTGIFEAEAAGFEERGFKSKDITTSALTANVAGTLLGVLAAAPLLILFFFTGSGVIVSSSLVTIIYVAALFVSVIIHELIHGFTWSLFTKGGFKSVAFGVIWKYLTPYCSCTEPLKRGQYIAGGIMPGLILGIIPQIIAVIIGNYVLMLYGSFMVICAGGDLLIFIMILKDRKSKEEYYLDHPTKIGLVKFYKDDSE